MKPEELCIGDLVRNDLGEIQKIEEIRQEDVMLSYNDYYSYDEIEPIPLTPEILEKNGFESVRGIMTFMDEYYDIQIEDWSDSIFRIRVDFCEMNTPHFQATISYAHELQHCLRLCGIDKEIILNFKED